MNKLFIFVFGIFCHLSQINVVQEELIHCTKIFSYIPVDFSLKFSMSTEINSRVSSLSVSKLHIRRDAYFHHLEYIFSRIITGICILLHNAVTKDSTHAMQ